MKEPCSNCPFRSDRPFRGLNRDRAEEIVKTLHADGGFHCHKTNKYDEETGRGISYNKFQAMYWGSYFSRKYTKRRDAC